MIFVHFQFLSRLQLSGVGFVAEIKNSSLVPVSLDPSISRLDVTTQSNLLSAILTVDEY